MERKREKTKSDFIRAEILRLKKIFKNLSPDAAEIALKLIENAAFMAVSLEELKQIINEKGYTEEYQNGANQFGVKKSSEVEVYNTMIKNFNQTMKQLCDLLPDCGSGTSGNDPLLDFIGNGAP